MIRRRVLPLLFGLFCLLNLAALRLSDPFPVQAVREIAFDLFQRLAPRPPAEAPVRVVDIDEASLAAIGQWPWPRTQLATLVERLAELGAASIVFDILFVEPDRLSLSRLARDPGFLAQLGADIGEAVADRLPDNDRIFAQAIEGRPVVLGFAVLSAGSSGSPTVKTGFAATGQDLKHAPPRLQAATHNLAGLEAAAAGIGSISLSPEETRGVIRKIPLIWTDGEKFYPSLALESLRVAQGVSTLVVHGAPNVTDTISTLRVGALDIPTTKTGEIWIHYAPEDRRRYVPAKDLLSGDTQDSLRAAIEGHIVLIGASAAGLLDIRTTSLGESVPGVSVHAQALEQALTGWFISRPDWMDMAEIGGLLGLGLAIVAGVVYGGALWALFLGAVLAIVVIAGTWLAFTQGGIMIDPTFPLVGALASHFAVTSFRYLAADRDKRAIRRAFAHYVAPSVLAEIERHPESLRLGGQIRPMTIMFVDIRNFTPLSERLPPTELVQLLNRLLDELSHDIVEEAGTLDKYIGDSIMAFWNAPIDVPAHQRRACEAALRMRRTLARLNAEDAFQLTARGLPATLEIGVGINSGEACVGNMGSAARFDYSVIGDAVNVASRVEGACKRVAYDVIVSEDTAKALTEMALLEAGSLALKGKSERNRLFIVVGDESMRATPDFQALEVRHLLLLAAMGQGDDTAADGMIRDCAAAAEAVSPNLVRFYEALRERLVDFRTN